MRMNNHHEECETLRLYACKHPSLSFALSHTHLTRPKLNIVPTKPYVSLCVFYHQCFTHIFAFFTPVNIKLACTFGITYSSISAWRAPKWLFMHTHIILTNFKCIGWLFSQRLRNKMANEQTATWKRRLVFNLNLCFAGSQWSEARYELCSWFYMRLSLNCRSQA